MSGKDHKDELKFLDVLMRGGPTAESAKGGELPVFTGNFFDVDVNKKGKCPSGIRTKQY